LGTGEYAGLRRQIGRKAVSQFVRTAQEIAEARKRKGRTRRPLVTIVESCRSALARLEARIALADHEDFAAAAHDLAIAMTLLGRFEGGQDFHDEFRWLSDLRAQKVAGHCNRYALHM
jgi:hypothetical protein